MYTLFLFSTVCGNKKDVVASWCQLWDTVGDIGLVKYSGLSRVMCISLFEVWWTLRSALFGLGVS